MSECLWGVGGKGSEVSRFDLMAWEGRVDYIVIAADKLICGVTVGTKVVGLTTLGTLPGRYARMWD